VIGHGEVEIFERELGFFFMGSNPKSDETSSPDQLSSTQVLG